MKYAVLVSRDFEKKCARLLKKYRSLSSDLKPLVARLTTGDFSPDSLVPGIDALVYKARLASSDQKRGKSGGYRVLYYVVSEDKRLILLGIYAKAQQENISPQEIKRLLKDFRG